MKIKLYCIIFIACHSLALFSQSIAFSPGDDGQLYPQFEMDWQYSQTAFGSSIRLMSLGDNETDRTSPGSGLDQSVTTMEEHYFGELIPVAYKLDYDSVALTPGVGLQSDWYNIQQVGYIDINSSDSTYRLFFYNDRQILSLRPGLHLKTDINKASINLRLSGFYSPFPYIRLDQEFSSAATETALYDTPVTTHSFSDFGSNAWGAQALLHWENSYLPLTIKTSWQGFAVDYTYVGIGGLEYDQSIENVNGSFDIQATLKFLEIRKSHPLVGIGWNWDWTTDTDSHETEKEDYPIRVFAGLSL